MFGISKKRLAFSTLIVLGVLAVPVGLGVVGWRALGLGALRFPEKEFEELDAKYAGAVEAARAMAEDDVQAQRAALAMARAAVPADAPIAADWNLEACLAGAWHPVQQDTLSDLSRDYLRLDSEEEPVTDDTIVTLKSRLGLAREAGNITELEERLDPNVQAPEDVVQHFREYVLSAPFLDEMEAAIDLGLCRWVPQNLLQEDEDFETKRSLLFSLLACRAIAQAEDGRQDMALENCLRLYRVSRTTREEPGEPVDWYMAPLPQFANAGLRSAIARGPVSAEWRERLLQAAQQISDPAALAGKLQTCAVMGFDNPDRISSPSLRSLDPRAERLSLYRAYAQAEAFIALLDRPPREGVDGARAIAQIYCPAMMRHISDEEPSEVRSRDILFAVAGADGDWDAWGVVNDLAAMWFQHAVDQTVPRLMETAFTLDDYHQANGAYPGSLDALVPQWIEAVPLDPLTANPITYERVDSGYDLKVVEWFHCYGMIPVEQTDLSEQDVVWAVRW